MRFIIFLICLLLFTPSMAHAFDDDEFCFYIMQSAEAAKAKPWQINEKAAVHEVVFSCDAKTVIYKESSESVEDISAIQDTFNKLYCAEGVSSLKPALESGWRISHSVAVKNGSTHDFATDCKE